MKNIFFILCLLPLSMWATDKPEYAVTRIDTALLKDAYAVVRVSNKIFNVDSPGEATEYVKKVVTRLSENDPYYEDLVVSYNVYAKVKKISATLYDAYGNKIREVKKKEIFDRSAVSSFSIYEDDRVKYIDLTYGVYPYTIEYEYEVVHNGIMLYPTWNVQYFHTSVEQSSYQLHLPNGIEVKSRIQNLAIQPKKKLEDGKEVWTWQTKDLKAKKYQSGMPTPFKELVRGYFTPNQFEVAGYQGDMTSWQAYGEFMYELNKGRDQLSPSMQKVVHDLTDGLDSDVEKINVLYRYLQQNMRYVSVQLGIGGWQTFDANYVEANKYGDCKALSNFMKSMLKEAGIESNATLIYASSNLPFEVSSDFSFPMFNHMILHIPQEDYWLECTSNYAPPNYLGSSSENRNVLLITPKGGKIVKTPEMGITQNQKQSKTHITINPKGEAVLKNHITYTGALQERLRYQSKTYTEKELKDALLEQSDLPMSEINNLNFETSETMPTVAVEYELNIPRYASKAGKRLFIPFNMVNLYSDIPTSAARIYPLKVDVAYTKQDTILIDLPAITTIESLPKSFELKSDFGAYSIDFQVNDKQIQCLRRLVIHKMVIQPDRYEEWRKFCQQVAKKDKAKIVVKISQA